MLASAKFFVKIRERRIYFIMKLFRLIGTMTIVAAVAATMAVSASAEAVAADYNAETGKVTFDAPATDNNNDYTVMVVSALVNNDVTEGDIFQLAQGSKEVVAPTEPGKYYATIGGYADGVKKSAEFVVPQLDTVEGTVVDTEEGEVASWYKVVTKAPKGLTPYWTAEGAEDLEALFGDKTANIEGNVMLGLVVEGETAPATVTLIWK
jgi:hypothetical protein